MSATPRPEFPHHDADLPRLVADEGFWDERYRSAPALWSGEPNPHVVTDTADLTPGTALDVGCGEGADTVWLAARGWRVTGADISTVALERAAEHARDAGVADRVDWLHLDLTRDAPPTTYDLVSAQFVHLPPELRDPAHARLAVAVAPGGTLLVVAHHPWDIDSGAPRPPFHELYFTPQDVAAVLDPQHWTVEVADVRPRPFTTADGAVVTIHDTVLRARRAA